MEVSLMPTKSGGMTVAEKNRDLQARLADVVDRHNAEETRRWEEENKVRRWQAQHGTVGAFAERDKGLAQLMNARREADQWTIQKFLNFKSLFFSIGGGLLLFYFLIGPGISAIWHVLGSLNLWLWAGVLLALIWFWRSRA